MDSLSRSHCACVAMFWFALHHSGKGGKHQDGPQRSITLRDITTTPVPTGELRSVVDIWDGRRAVLALNFSFPSIAIGFRRRAVDLQRVVGHAEG
jgi:hypothetical protein